MLCALAAAPAAGASNGIEKERTHAKLVETRVNAMGMQLEGVVQRWDGERNALVQVDARLRTANSRIRIASTNLSSAQQKLEQRLLNLYVSPPPDAVALLVGAKSFSDLIDTIEATHAFSQQDRQIAAAASGYRAQLARERAALRKERRNRTHLIAHLADERAQITQTIAAQKHLLASIHETIATLQAREAARERAAAALARKRIERQVALARERAREQVLQAQTPVAPPATAPEPAPAPAPSPAPAAPAPAAPAPAPAPPTPSPAPPPAPTTHATAASIAARYLGVPYAWGGASPAGFDCSGLVMYVYAQLGVSLPHYTVSQWNATTPIPTSSLAPGDLVFFDGLGHVGIYIGSGQFIHAPHTGTVVQIASLTGYWAEHLDGARRVR